MGGNILLQVLVPYRLVIVGKNVIEICLAYNSIMSLKKYIFLARSVSFQLLFDFSSYGTSNRCKVC